MEALKLGQRSFTHCRAVQVESRWVWALLFSNAGAMHLRHNWLLWRC